MDFQNIWLFNFFMQWTAQKCYDFAYKQHGYWW